MTDRSKCTVKGCEREAKAHGMCGLHQMRVLRTGSPNKTRWPGPKRDPFRSKVRTRALSRDWRSKLPIGSGPRSISARYSVHRAEA